MEIAMTDEQSKQLVVSVRFPSRELYEEVRAWAAGNRLHPRTSISAAIVFLVREGLRVQRAQEQRAAEGDALGKIMPILRRAA